MELVRLRGNSLNPLPAENPATPLIQADPSLSTPDGRVSDSEDLAWPSPPQSAVNFEYADESRPSSRQSLHPELAEPRFGPPRPKLSFRGFEKPSLTRIATLSLLCLITYPVFYVLTLVAKDKSLFTVRVIVSVWCSGGGFALGYFILEIGAQYLEAASKFEHAG